MDFRGGTYISQVSAADLYSAEQIWAATLEIDEIQYLGLKIQKQIIELLNEEDEVPDAINETRNVWTHRLISKAGIHRLHIIKTAIT